MNVSRVPRNAVGIALVLASLVIASALPAQTWEKLKASAQVLPYDSMTDFASGEVSDGQAVFEFNVEGSGPHTLEVIVTTVRMGLEHEDDDTVLFVFDEDGYLIAENDDGPVGMASLINGADLPVPGTYYAIVTTYPRFVDTDDSGRFVGFTEPGQSSVAFDLTIEFGSRDIAYDEEYDDSSVYAEIVYDWNAVVELADPIRLQSTRTTIAGNIDLGIDVIAFDVDRAMTLDVEVVIDGGVSADSILSIFDEQGMLVIDDDDGGVDTASRVEAFELPAGRYYVVVSAYPNFAETDWDGNLLGFSDYAEEYFEYTLVIERSR